MTHERDAVTRARERLDDAVSMFAAFHTDAARDEVDRCIDAYAAAVRQQAFADAVRVVEGCKSIYPICPLSEAQEFYGEEGEAYIMLDDTLAALRTLAQETTDER